MTAVNPHWDLLNKEWMHFLGVQPCFRSMSQVITEKDHQYWQISFLPYSTHPYHTGYLFTPTKKWQKLLRNKHVTKDSGKLNTSFFSNQVYTVQLFFYNSTNFFSSNLELQDLENPPQTASTLKRISIQRATKYS